MKSKLISRRGFIRRAGTAVGTALALPTFLPSSVLGRSGAIAPSERITMGFIGCGNQGSGHLLGGGWTYVAGGYAGRKEVQVLAVCDLWPEKRERNAKKVNDHYAEVYGDKFTKCEAYQDFRLMLERKDIDAVLVCTPAHWHATMAVLVAQAGKDVYCEKPSAVTVDEAIRLRTAIKRYGRIYQAGTQQRSEYGGKFRAACEFVRSGRIGKLKSIYAYRDGGGIYWPKRFGAGIPVPKGFDWNYYLGPAPWFPYDGITGPHRFDIGELNWGQHHYDIVQWGADADSTGPVEVFLQDKRTCYKYPSGVVVYGMAPPADVGAGFAGNSGDFTAELANMKVRKDGGVCFVGSTGCIAVDRDVIISSPGDLVREPLRANDVHLYHSTSHSGNFLECIRTRQPTICNEDVACRSASALLLGGIAKQLDRSIKWDPVAEKFHNDEEATRFLSIAKRAPWNI